MIHFCFMGIKTRKRFRDYGYVSLNSIWMFKLQRFICKIKQSIWQSFRVMLFILCLFKDCCFCCEPCSLFLGFLSLSSAVNLSLSASSRASSSFLLTSSCFSNSSFLRCSSKASCFALISAEVIFARIFAACEDLAVVEVLLKLHLTELNPLELSSALSSRCALATNLASWTLSSCSSYQSNAVSRSFCGIT